MKKKLLTILLATVTLFGMTQLVPIKAATKTTRKNWYKKVLSSKKGTYKVKTYDAYNASRKAKYKTKYRKNYKYYKALDINKDGTKELILSNTKKGTYYKGSILVLTYYKGKVKPQYCFDESRGIRIKNHKLNSYSAGSDYAVIRSYKIRKGNLTNAVFLKFFNDRSGNHGAVQKYYKNNKRISKNTYEKEANKCWNGGTDITFNKIK